MKLGIITIGQAPRADLTPELRTILPAATELFEAGALDDLSPDKLETMAPAPGKHALTSRMRDGSAVVFGHHHAVPLIADAVSRAEDEGVALSLLVCSGKFPTVPHRRPLLRMERLAHDGVRSLVLSLAPSAPRLGIVRPLADQVDDAYEHWHESVGLRPALVRAASPYTDSISGVAAVAAETAAGSDLVVLDCAGFTEAMRLAAQEVCGAVPVVTVRSVAAHLLSCLL